MFSTNACNNVIAKEGDIVEEVPKYYYMSQTLTHITIMKTK